MMKQAEYNAFVEKLAEEIVNGDLFEKVAEEEEAAKPAISPTAQAVIAKATAEKKEEKEEEEEEDEDKEAAAAIEAIEKAAAVWEEAEAIEKAAQNAHQNAQAYKDAAMKVFKQYGYVE